MFSISLIIATSLGLMKDEENQTFFPYTTPHPKQRWKTHLLLAMILLKMTTSKLFSATQLSCWFECSQCERIFGSCPHLQFLCRQPNCSQLWVNIFHLPLIYGQGSAFLEQALCKWNAWEHQNPSMQQENEHKRVSLRDLSLKQNSWSVFPKPDRSFMVASPHPSEHSQREHFLQGN